MSSLQHSSSRKALRSDRLNQSPYTRPAERATRASASSPFSTLRSLYSLVTSPFSRSSSSVLPTHASRPPDVDQQSESGSEDEWTGQPPEPMAGKDVFDLAAAAGRDGGDFEKRAKEWRSKGEVPGGRRQLVRAGLESRGTPSLLSPHMPGQLLRVKASPSMPALTAPQASASSSTPYTNPLKRSFPSSTPGLPSRAPLPSFLPVASTSQAPPPPQTPSSLASSAALTAFLDAKRGQALTPDDIGVIDTLTQNIKHEATATTSPAGSESAKLGGWAAGDYTGVPRPSELLRGKRAYTPLRSQQSTPARGGSAFSLGVDPPTPQSAGGTPHRIRYLGPGMSPRRMFGKDKSKGLKPLFHFGKGDEEVDGGQQNGDEGETPKKKRRTEPEADDREVEKQTQDIPPVPAVPARFAGLSSSVSMPNLAQSSRTPAVPSPLAISSTSSSTAAESPKKKQDAVTLGKARAAEIMRQLIVDELGPLDAEASKNSEPIVINPYDTTSLSPSSSSTPEPKANGNGSFTPRRSTPSKSGLGRSVLRSSLRGKDTPLRGAAKKLAEQKGVGRKLTTRELVEGVRPWAESSDNAREDRQKDVNEREDTHRGAKEATGEEMEVDGLVEPSAPSTPAEPKAKEPERRKMPEAEVFKSFAAPQLETGPPAAVPQSPARPPKNDVAIPTFADFTPSKPAEPTKKFELSAHTPTSLPDDDDHASSVKAPAPSRPSSSAAAVDGSKVFLSAKDAALAVSSPSLPFFTFTLPTPPASTSQFHFTVVPPPRSASILDAPPRTDKQYTWTIPGDGSALKPKLQKKGEGEWTCDTCMLKNPDSAREKCTICEAPRPVGGGVSVQVSKEGGKDGVPKWGGVPLKGWEKQLAPPKVAGGTGGQWECGLCMLKNPDSAKDKCQICEAPRP